MKILTECSDLKTDWIDVRFIGMNTYSGFKESKSGLPGEKELKRTYIIKGGPGTGKSTLMKKVADHFEKSNHSVCRCLCSSDPGSLDAVLIDKKIIIIDGTAPHVKEMKYPGAGSEAVCLSNFWSRNVLMAKRDEIERLTDEKSNLFDRAYGIMSSVKSLYDGVFADAEKYYLRDKALSVAERIAKKHKENGAGKTEYIIRSFGMKGAVRLDTFDKLAETTVFIRDCYGAALLFLDDLSDALTKRGVGFLTSPDPQISDKTTDLFIPGKNVLFTVNENTNADKIINAERFVDKERLKYRRGSVKLSLKCARELISDALSVMKQISERHFGLEKIYGSAMNFDAIGEYTKLLIRDIETII